jgi:hypothetical protein
MRFAVGVQLRLGLNRLLIEVLLLLEAVKVALVLRAEALKAGRLTPDTV